MFAYKSSRMELASDLAE